MLIYRVENANGCGMYMGNDHSFSYEMIDSMRHPTPNKDASLSKFWNALSFERSQAYSFGYGSLEQLKNWIYQDSWRKEIDESGFRVYVYDSKHFEIGDTQAVFIKQTATLQYSLSILEI